MIMKRRITTTLAVIIAMTFLVGCVTTSGGSKSSSSSGVKKAPPGTYSQVPASLRGPVKEAEFDLKQAQSNQKLADERVKLAALQKEWAVLNDKNAGYVKKLAQVQQSKAEVIVEVKKAEAIDNAGLGDKEENIKNIAKLRTKELDVSTDEIKIQADIDTTELKLRKLDKQIRSQKAAVAKAAGHKTKSAKSKKKPRKVSKKK
jgi:hypothetical protein